MCGGSLLSHHWKPGLQPLDFDFTLRQGAMKTDPAPALQLDDERMYGYFSLSCKTCGGRTYRARDICHKCREANRPVKERVLFDPVKAFFDKINPVESGCWEWTASLFRCGYGQFGAGKYAHRWSYEFFTGPIPEGLDVDHVCRNRKCVNPDHLEAVTRSVNIKRAWDARKGKL